MRIILESISLFELQIDLASVITLLPNFVFYGVGIASSFNFSDSLVFFKCFIKLPFRHSSLSLHSSFLSFGELLGKFLMLHHMPLLFK